MKTTRCLAAKCAILVAANLIFYASFHPARSGEFIRGNESVRECLDRWLSSVNISEGISRDSQGHARIAVIGQAQVYIHRGSQNFVDLRQSAFRMAEMTSYHTILGLINSTTSNSTL